MVDDISLNNPEALEKRSREATRAKFAEWRKQEREQRPRRILLFFLSGTAVVVATFILILTHGGA
jgi:hypothetical protein